MTRKRALGRGLDALIGAGARSRSRHSIEAQTDIASVPEQRSTPAVRDHESEHLAQIPIMQLTRGEYQPRREFQPERLEELAASIRARGIMQPLVVRPLPLRSEGPRYEIIAGERRWRAAQMAALDTVPAVIREMDDETALALSLIENIQREDLSAIEEAIALKRLMDEFSLTQQQTADAVGKSRAQIANLLRLLQLEPEVRAHLERGELDVGHARALLALKGAQQCAAARDVIAQEMTVRQTEACVRRCLEGQPRKAEKPVSQDVTRLENRLCDVLGAAVKIDHKASGKGRVTIRYTSLDELDGILAHIK